MTPAPAVPLPMPIAFAKKGFASKNSPSKVGISLYGSLENIWVR